MRHLSEKTISVATNTNANKDTNTNINTKQQHKIENGGDIILEINTHHVFVTSTTHDLGVELL